MNKEQSSRRQPLHELRPPSDATGNGVVADVLFAALEAACDEDVHDNPFPHGFHSWPAGLHPAIARTVLDGLLPSLPEGGVVDPFCGGGTVGLEAILHHRPFMGLDLNPLSALVAAERCRSRSVPAANAVRGAVERVVERSKERVRAKRPARADVPPEVASAYAPHVIVELAGLLAEIDAVDGRAVPGLRATMAVCFSAILTKVSQRRGDTDTRGQSGPSGKRIGRFVPTERFADKVHELLTRQLALHDVLGDRVRARFITADARSLKTHVEDRPVAMVLTSPPYGGTYDYADHHAHRLAFLGLDDSAFRRQEIGARRRQRLQGSFDDEVREMLTAMAQVLNPETLAVLVVGDAQLEGRRIPADEHLNWIAPSAGLRVVATAKAPRPDWRGGPDRFEHLIALTSTR